MTKRPDLDGRHRAAWILIILIFPLIGTLAYFFARPTLPDERERMMRPTRPNKPDRYLLGSYRIATALEPNSCRLTSFKSTCFDSPANNVGP
jgi:Phospholipase_D-nuclease N-terminal